MSVKCVKIEPINKVDKILYKYFTCGFRKGYIEVGDEKCTMPEYYSTIADEIENFEVKDTDIWLTSHPKTGTTWTQEMIWMIVNNLDFEGAKQELHDRIPFLEFKSIFDYRDDTFKDVKENANKSLINSIELSRDFPTTPRMIKTHLPFSLLPIQIRNKTKKPKIIHVVRNAKDTCVSYYYHCKLLEGYTGNFEDFCTLFLAGRLSWSPFWGNIMSYWTRREEYNILIIKYEDMKKDLGAVILKVAEYLGKTLSPQQVSILKDHLSFENMKNNNSVNLESHCAMTRKLNNCEGTFMRSGTVGSYKVDMNEEMINKFDEWTAENTAGTGLTFGGV